jgi:hypothetical protein
MSDPGPAPAQGGAPPAPACACFIDPPSNQFELDIPGAQLEYSVPLSSYFCKLGAEVGLLGDLSATLNVRADASYGNNGATCTTTAGLNASLTGRVSLCGPGVAVRATFMGDYNRQDCKTCLPANAPVWSCTGLKCETANGNARYNALLAYEAVLPLGDPDATIGGSLKARLELGGAPSLVGLNYVLNGVNPACGNCGPGNPDCLYVTASPPGGPGGQVVLTGAGSLRLGPVQFKAQAQGNLSMGTTIQTRVGATCPAPLFCFAGYITGSIIIEGRAQAGTAGFLAGGTLLSYTCNGQWTRSSCVGPSATPTQNWSCRWRYPRVRINGWRFPF